LLRGQISTGTCLQSGQRFVPVDTGELAIRSGLADQAGMQTRGPRSRT
jgi:hypothetical protein